MTASKYLKLSTLALAVALAACGGGGGDSSTGTDLPGNGGSNGGGGSAVDAPTPIQTTVPTATYAAGSGQATAYALLNTERGRCGFGLLAQNDKLDLVAADAVNYWKLRLAESEASASAYSHVQAATKTGFTGETPVDRAQYRGYAGGIGENLSRSGTAVAFVSDAGAAAQQTRTLLTSVYHLGSLMSGFTEVGVAYAGAAPSPQGNLFYATLFELGLPAGRTVQDVDSLRTFPCEGTQHANATFAPASESPNPAPDLGAITVGTPILVQAMVGKSLVIETYSIGPAAGGAQVASRLITAATDVHGAVEPHTAFIVPLSQLIAGQTYRVHLTAKVDGQPASSTFNFVPANAAAGT